MELVHKDVPTGSKKVFLCPYHGWSYGSDGSLLHVPFGEEGFGNSDEVQLEHRNLIPLPTQERVGLLFVIPTPTAAPEADRKFADHFPEGCMRELGLYSFGKHHRIVEQSLLVDANWKLVNDTFDEIYHLNSLHPLLREQNVSNCSVFRAFPTRDGSALHSDMLVGRFTTRIMAAGEVDESRWDEPSVLDHCNHVYNLAPNTIFFVQASNIIMCQQWPGDHAGQCVQETTLYNPFPPETREQVVGSQRQFSFMLDVIATEDFPCLPRMQENVAQNKHVEVVFGRNEPALIDRHRYFQRAVQGKF